MKNKIALLITTFCKMMWHGLSAIKYWLLPIFCKYLSQSSYMKYLISLAWIWVRCCDLGLSWELFWLSVFGRVAKTLIRNTKLSIKIVLWVRHCVWTGLDISSKSDRTDILSFLWQFDKTTVESFTVSPRNSRSLH